MLCKRHYFDMSKAKLLHIIANLMRKLGLRSVALLTQFTIREGLLQAP